LSISPWNLSLDSLLPVRPEKYGMRDNVPLHGFFQCRFVGVAEIGQCGIERI